MKTKEQKTQSTKDSKRQTSKPSEKPTSKNATIEDAPAPRAEQAP